MKTKMIKMIKDEKEMADRKVESAIAVLRQVEMELHDAQREYQYALDSLREAQEERDKLLER